MSTTTIITPSSSPTKVKRTRSIMLTPTKHSKAEQSEPEREAKPRPTHQELLSWTTTNDAIAPCHIKDVYSLQERAVAGGVDPPQPAKQPDFYWLGRAPCRTVQIVGIVVGVSQYEGRTVYIVDDGTEVIECAQRSQPAKRPPEPGKSPFLAPEFSLPVASVGDSVCVVGRASRTKSNEWQILVNSIVLCSSRNEELIHHLKVRKLHETNYSLSDPFYPPSTTQVIPVVPVTPTRKQIPQEPLSKASNLTAQSSPVTVIASSPIKSEHVQATPTKLRHPSRLHHMELTRNTFRIYLKYFMDTGPANNIEDTDDPFAPSFAPEPTTPTKNHATPKPTQFSKTTDRPNIDPIFFGQSVASSSKDKKVTPRGYTISYLRRVPELVLLANRVAKQEIRMARKQEKEKKPASSSSSTAKSIGAKSTARSSKARNPTSKDIKRLFLRAVNDLYREGSIVIWDCPSYPCQEAASADTSFLWKPITNASGVLSMSYASNTTAASDVSSSVFRHPASKSRIASGTMPQIVTEDPEGELSDPDPNEDVYIPVKPCFLADRLEEIIPIVQNAERRGHRESQAKRSLYQGASSQGLLQYLKRDDRWTFVHVDIVDAALRYLEEDGRNPSMGPTDEKKDLPSGSQDDVVIESKQLGVWRLLWVSDKGRPISQYIEEFRTFAPYVTLLFFEVYAVAPRLFMFFVMSRVWAGVEHALTMYLSTRILRAMELGITQEPSFVQEIVWALSLRVLYSALLSYVGWLSEDRVSQLRTRVISHFDVYLMEAKLRMDIPTSLDAGNKVDSSGKEAWDAFYDIVNYQQSIIELFSQILVIYKEARDTGGLGFVFICLVNPLYGQLFRVPVWQKVCYAYVNNDAYIRAQALKDLASGRFREDVLTTNMGSWIIEQYKASHETIGHLSDEHPLFQVDTVKYPIERMVLGALEDLPIVYCGLNVIISPSRFSLANIAIMQTASTTLRHSVAMLFHRNRSLGKNVNAIKEIYSVSKIQNQVDGGKAPYPSSEKPARDGMSFELRNLSFSYPGSHKTTYALDRINLTIPGGSIVVIVGSNGSGKSTLIRILSRLFTPSSGEILIDGCPAESFDLVDLRRASMLLSQENKVYPLSLAENIGLGCLEMVDDKKLIEEAAEKGGAAGFISKLDMRYETVLSPPCPSMTFNLHGKPEHPLQKEIAKLPKSTSVSGGETQRLVAARSFMRLNSGKIKFIAVDEPSSALDAEGELQLFNRLLEAREGKTVLFVTHRFGHLTKHADMIICLKDGAIAESGSHEELMKNDGEYAKLYHIQASAFAVPQQPAASQNTSEST